MTDEKQSLLDHIEELRKTFFKILIGLVVGVVVAAFFVKPILDFLATPIGGLEKLHAIEVTESVGVYMRIALLAGFLLALPWIFYQLFRFVGKGLTEKERKTILIAVPFATLMFLGGVTFAYFVMLPASLDFLIGILGINTMIRVKSYFSFITNLLFWIGISFEMPLIVYVLARFGLLKAKVMLKGWRVAIVVIAILAAVITPTSDPVNMTIFMIPLFVLYLLSIGLAAIAEKQRVKTKAATTTEVQMPQLGIWEVLIIILIIVILFGAGRIAKAGGELGKGIRAFKEGLQGKDSETTDQDDAEIDSAKEDK